MALKIGSEDKKKAAIAAGLGLVALFLIARTFLFSSAPAPAAPPPAIITSSAATTGSTKSAAGISADAAGKKLDTAAAGSASINPQLRFDLLAQSETTEYKGTGRNIFSLTAPPPVIEKLIAPIRPAGPVIPQGPPPPPPIDLKFYGFEQKKGEAKRVFLLHGEDVFIAAEGDIVDRRYKVMRIQPTSVQVEDILNNNTQTLPLTQQG